MNFFEMNFSTLFADKHGKEIFDEICMLIAKEKVSTSDNNYIEIIFKIAFLSFFGIDDEQIKKMIGDTMKCTEINITKVKYIHKVSISEIQKYLQIATN